MDLTPQDWKKIFKVAPASCAVDERTPHKWRERKRIPAGYVPKLAKATGIARRKLRPDLWGHEPPPSPDST